MPDYPSIFRVRQSFPRSRVEDPAGEVRRQLAGLALERVVKPGATVAVTAGSRGITNIHVILRAVVEHLKQLGARPFLVPAMGSHGGGTAEGQRKVIESYGVTEDFCGCPIRASMDTVVVCRAAEGFPVHFDKFAHQADHVLVCGRVKPHTNFAGDIESGLMKMLLIGLGKHAGAKIYHRAIQDYDFGRIVRSVGGEILNRLPVVAGLAIVENAYDETGKIEAVRPQDFPTREQALLRLARQWLPSLPFPTAHVLIVDEIGKNIAGTGIDTNVVGRKRLAHQAAEDERPQIKYIVVRGLTEATHGNATGIGLVEFCRSRVVRQMDVGVTRVNCLTAGRPLGAMLPIHYDTDREILDAALPAIGLTEPRDAELMWIRNTLDVAEVECSTAYLEEARSRSDLEILAPPRPLPLGPDGNLCAAPAGPAATG